MCMCVFKKSEGLLLTGFIHIVLLYPPSPRIATVKFPKMVIILRSFSGPKSHVSKSSHGYCRIFLARGRNSIPQASLKLLKDLCNSQFATLDFKGLPEINLEGNVF